MENKQNKASFEDINQMYLKYLELDIKPRNEEFEKNWVKAYDSLKEKIIIGLYKYYVHDFTGKEIDPDKADGYHTDIIIEEIKAALEKYRTSGSQEKGYSFTQYTCMKINNRISVAKSMDIISRNLGGSSIKASEAKKIRSVIKLDNLLQKKIDDEEVRNKKISKALNISIEEVIEYRSYGSNRTVSADSVYKNQDGESYSVLDLAENLTDANYVKYDSVFEAAKEKAKLEEILQNLKELLSKKNDPFLSEVMTLAILKSYEKDREEYLKKSPGSLQFFCTDTYEKLAENSYLDKKMLDGFFRDADYELPAQNALAEKAGVDKTTVSKKIERFRDKLNKS